VSATRQSITHLAVFVVATPGLEPLEAQENLAEDGATILLLVL